MRTPCLAGLSTVLAITLLSLQPAAGQAPAEGSSLPRTPDGRPDLQGVWDFRTITPMERPEALAGKAVLTDEEAASFEQAENRRLNRDLIDPEKGGAFYPPESEGGVVPYNEFWYDRGTTVIGDKRTSLIVDPANGRIPPLTPDGQRRAADVAAAMDRPARGPEDRGIGERCILGFNAAPPGTQRLQQQYPAVPDARIRRDSERDGSQVLASSRWTDGRMFPKPFAS